MSSANVLQPYEIGCNIILAVETDQDVYVVTKCFSCVW